MKKWKLTEQEMRILADRIAWGCNKYVVGGNKARWAEDYTNTYNSVMDELCRYNQSAD